MGNKKLNEELRNWKLGTGRIVFGYFFTFFPTVCARVCVRV